MSQDGWLSTHAYLEPVAHLCAEVERAAAGIEIPSPDLPCFDDYAGDFREGVPLLQSSHVALDLAPAGRLMEALLGNLSSQPLSGRLASDAAALHSQLRREPDAGRAIPDWLLGGDAFVPASPGFLRYLGWTLMARYLSPVAEAFGRWRDEERWLRRYCPLCGSPPAMAQLAGVDPGRKRLLSCGCCGTRWQYKRTACPFCEVESQRLASLAVEGEAGLRIDSCEACGGYLKTYDGQGNEALLLADWSSLHLDLIAQDRGLKRLAASLYEFETSPPPAQGSGA